MGGRAPARFFSSIIPVAAAAACICTTTVVPRTGVVDTKASATHVGVAIDGLVIVIVLTVVLSSGGVVVTAHQIASNRLGCDYTRTHRQSSSYPTHDAPAQTGARWLWVTLLRVALLWITGLGKGWLRAPAAAHTKILRSIETILVRIVRLLGIRLWIAVTKNEVPTHNNAPR